MFSIYRDKGKGHHHALNVRVLRTRIRFVYSKDGRAGMYGPQISVFRTGPNGSPAGTGPKAWPLWISKIAGPYYDRDYNRTYGPRRSHALVIPCPHISWGVAYKLRRFGMLPVYKLVYRMYPR